jgi:hypothetical protein
LITRISNQKSRDIKYKKKKSANQNPGGQSQSAASLACGEDTYQHQVDMLPPFKLAFCPEGVPKTRDTLEISEIMLTLACGPKNQDDFQSFQHKRRCPPFNNW